MDQANEARKPQADLSWERARASFTKAVELYGKPQDAATINLLARLQVDLAQTYKWKEKVDEATSSYALAMGLDPSVVNFSQVRNLLGTERFQSALENGAKAHAERYGTKTNADAQLLWWLGYARFEQKQYAKADEAFSEAVVKAPTYYNSWFYCALARYHQQNFE